MADAKRICAGPHWNETAPAGLRPKHALVQHDLTARDHRRRPAAQPLTGIGREIDRVPHHRPIDGDVVLRIPQHQVGIGANGQAPLAGHAEQRRGPLRNQLHKAAKVDPPA